MVYSGLVYLIAVILYRLFLCHYSLLVLVDEKMNFIPLPAFESYHVNTETDVPQHQQRWWLKPHSRQNNEEYSLHR